MKLKKSSGTKMDMDQAREEIADHIRPKRSKTRVIGMILGAVVAMGAILYAISTFTSSEEDM